MAKAATSIEEAHCNSCKWISTNPRDYWDILKSLFILIVIYFITDSLGIFHIHDTIVNDPSNLGVVFLIGLTAGISTCMASISGLILAISARYSELHANATTAQKFKPHLFFNLGRVLAYSILGGLVGLVGKLFQLSDSILLVLGLILGFVMLFIGIQLTEVFPRISHLDCHLPKSIKSLIKYSKKLTENYSHTNTIVAGALTFFLPCGFTQAMQFYAMTTGSFWSGFFVLGAFALGTTPGFLGIGGITSILNGRHAKNFFRFTGLIVIALALVSIYNSIFAIK